MANHKWTVRVLPLSGADGPTNMAIDEVLLQSAQRGTTTLRFYTWSTPTASLGYFQPHSVLKDISWPDTLPWVRRASGGLTLVHDQELTYALAAPADFPLIRQGCLTGMHSIIRGVMEWLRGIKVEMVGCSTQGLAESPLCFLHQTPGDLCFEGQKVVGSAQRKQRGAVLQHGSILLHRSEHAPALAGIMDLTDHGPEPKDWVKTKDWSRTIYRHFEFATGSELSTGELTPTENSAVADLVKNKYALASWNEKR